MTTLNHRYRTLEALVREFLDAYDALNSMTTSGTTEKLQHQASIVARLRQHVRPGLRARTQQRRSIVVTDAGRAELAKPEVL